MCCCPSGTDRSRLADHELFLNHLIGRAGARGALLRRSGRFLFDGGAFLIQSEKFFQDLLVVKIDIEPVGGGHGGIELGVRIGEPGGGARCAFR
jgi:hypothetical protein